MKIRFLTQDGVITKEAAAGGTLLDLLRDTQGVSIAAPCGGRGTCGKCIVYRVGADGETRVLACREIPSEDADYRVPQEGTMQILASGNSVDIKPDDNLTGFGIACDIGTTTVVCRLVDLSDGRILFIAAQPNAQRAYGADVISRIQAASEGKLAALQQAITGQLTGMVTALAKKRGLSFRKISRISIAANTTMCHLLTGLDPSGLGRAPFTPASLFGTEICARDIGIASDAAVYIAPAVSGYVGGDITADLLAQNLDRAKKPVLLIDVGTNGEMALGCGEHFICCSTAAGPAFEGAQISCGMTASVGAVSAVEWKDGSVFTETIGGAEPAGICGSGLIDAAAMLLDIGAVDETGRMMDPEEDAEDIDPAVLPYLFYDEEERPAFRICEDVFITQADIRKLQLGKGAIGAGVRVLTDLYGTGPDGIGELLLAGGFGSYIRPRSAARIGLIPEELLPVTRAVGNAACDGAQAALLSGEARERLLKIRASMEYFELSGSARFNDAYMEEMMFPEAE